MNSRGKNTHKPKPVLNALAAKNQSQLQNAVALHQQGHIKEAQEIYESILGTNPKHFDALHLLGVVAMQLKDFQLAADLIGKAIAIYNKNPNFYCNRGIALRALKKLDAAISSYDHAIRLKPDNADAYYNRGIALAELGKFDAAASSYDRAIRLKPSFAEAYSNRGIALQELAQLDAALASYDRAISINPNFADAYANRGNALRKAKRLEASVASYDRAISIKPDHADAYCNRGVALHELKQLNAAVTSCDKAISIKPDYAEAYFNRGNVLEELRQLDAAIASYERAINIKPEFADAFSGLGNAFEKLKQLDSAVVNYERAITLKPNFEFLFGNLLHTKMKLCDWGNLENNTAELVNKINANIKASPSFCALGLIGSPPVLRKAAEIWVSCMQPSNSSLGVIPKQQRSNKIRIGYYSADFHNHATSYLMAELFERHDNNKFELFAFSFGPAENDAMRQRVSNAFDHFIDVRMKSDKSIAELSRELGICIAVDLKGHTTDSRTGIFSYKAAPIQVSYLGFPGTMGADYINYLIADKILIPVESQPHYSEKIVYLPDSYQVNDRKRVIAERTFTKSELGLPADGFVYCCFNNNFKITPTVFDSWMRILNSVKGSVLWLFEDNPSSAINLIKEVGKRGLDPKRVIFAKKMSLAEHLARHQHANLFLDTLPCNAHTTCSDALWAGLPVLTCVGDSFAGRVAASLLNAIDLTELITRSPAEYEALAIELGNQPEKLHALKEKLAANKLTTPLFDTSLFTKNIEAAYTQMYDRYHADLPPSHIYVE